MLKINDIFNETIQKVLFPFQLEKLTKEIDSFVQLNKQALTYHFDVCPKCGAKHPHLTKGGFSNSGKQMLRCHECNQRFVIDHGQLTYYSHQSQDKWNDLILKTQNGQSIIATAKDINVSESTAFRMRHKYLHMLEKSVPPICSIE